MVPSKATILIALAAFCAPLQAQRYTDLGPGTRVRVSVANERLEGVVHSISFDTLSLVLSRAIPPVAIPFSSIHELETSLGPSRTGHAFLGGAIGGSIFGLRMWAVNEEPKTHHFRSDWQAAAVGGALGFALGAWMGSHIPNERWRAVHLPN